jgi:hypothetical protein
MTQNVLNLIAKQWLYSSLKVLHRFDGLGFGIMDFTPYSTVPYGTVLTLVVEESYYFEVL